MHNDQSSRLSAGLAFARDAARDEHVARNLAEQASKAETSHRDLFEQTVMDKFLQMQMQLVKLDAVLEMLDSMQTSLGEILINHGEFHRRLDRLEGILVKARPHVVPLKDHPLNPTHLQSLAGAALSGLQAQAQNARQADPYAELAQARAELDRRINYDGKPVRFVERRPDDDEEIKF
jgi:hypothetical protein